MDKVPWIAVGLAAVLLLAVGAGVAADRNTPQDAARSAPTAPGDAGLIQISGTSTLAVTGACLAQAARCVGEKETEDGAFFLPAAASGRVEVHWTPVNESLRVLRVSIGGIEEEGPSPLVFDGIGLSAGRYGVHVEPARSVVGVVSQRVEWRASFLVTALPSSVESRGQSGYTVLGACAAATCVPSVATRSDAFVAPWIARGGADFTWENGQSLRVAIPGTEYVVEGKSPLRLTFHDLPADQHGFLVTPVGPALPLASNRILWSVAIQPA